MKRKKPKILQTTVQKPACYVFQNNTRGDLSLPNIKEMLKVNEQFEGSEYYMQFVPTLLKYINKIDHTLLQENGMDKLITEQPPHIEKDGKVEFVKNGGKREQQQQFDEKIKLDPQEEILINEDSVGSIEII